MRKDTLRMSDLAAALAVRSPRRVEGTAVFLTSDPEIVPVALLHNLKHNRVLHRTNIILNVSTATQPYVEPLERLTVARLDDNFACATLHYGYMEAADIPTDLLADPRIPQSGGGASFFIGRNSVGAAKKGKLPFWQDVIFIFLQRNASDPTAFFRIPPNRVVELGSRIEV
jgi:KUP system potassium uptake protein